MSRNNQQRRAARAKQRQQRGPTRRAAPGSHPDPQVPRPDDGGSACAQQEAADALELLQGLARLTVVSLDHLGYAVQHELGRYVPAVRAATADLVVEELTARVARAWEAGWQPRDLVHVAARQNARVADLAAGLIVHQFQRSGATACAPEAWLVQLRSLGAAPGDQADPTHPVRPTRSWRPLTDPGDTTRQGLQDWIDLLSLLKLLIELVPLEAIGPPPSRWTRRVRSVAPRTDRDRMLNRIRALLAKAEATNHSAEAETFTAKAQELMSRHAIDEALLRDGQHDDVAIEVRRVHLRAPYAQVKAMLLGVVARANRSRAVFFEAYDLCTLVGTPADVDNVEMLFTSLLIQATRAMTEAGTRGAGSFDRSATFRRSFLTAYASRIGERLEEADRATTQTYGAELVPVLQREADAVAAEFDRLFPHTKSVSAGSLDARGWHAGRAAADQASFAVGRLTA